MSVEELKIREEIELDIENNLEEEIKDEIYHLVLKLHRLYQHQKQKTSNQSSSDHNQNGRKNARKKMLSEGNINIKLEGGTTIQINEIKKEARGPGHLIPVVCARKRAQIVQGNTTGPTIRAVKFDWARSLRSEGPGAMIVNSGSQDRSWDKLTGLFKDGEGGYGNQKCITKAEWKY